jgi:hypothetical protein
VTGRLENEMSKSSLVSHSRRVAKLEAIRARRSQHVVLVFTGTPEADAIADKRVEDGRVAAEQLGKELRVIRVGWKT